jgi:hypothetical protein
MSGGIAIAAAFAGKFAAEELGIIDPQSFIKGLPEEEQEDTFEEYISRIVIPAVITGTIRTVSPTTAAVVTILNNVITAAKLLPKAPLSNQEFKEVIVGPELIALMDKIDKIKDDRPKMDLIGQLMKDELEAQAKRVARDKLSKLPERAFGAPGTTEMFEKTIPLTVRDRDDSVLAKEKDFVMLSDREIEAHMEESRNEALRTSIMGMGRAPPFDPRKIQPPPSRPELRTTKPLSTPLEKRSFVLTTDRELRGDFQRAMSLAGKATTIEDVLDKRETLKGRVERAFGESVPKTVRKTVPRDFRQRRYETFPSSALQPDSGLRFDKGMKGKRSKAEVKGVTRTKIKKADQLGRELEGYGYRPLKDYYGNVWQLPLGTLPSSQLRN